MTVRCVGAELPFAREAMAAAGPGLGTTVAPTFAGEVERIGAIARYGYNDEARARSWVFTWRV